MILSGWGRYPKLEASLERPRSELHCARALADSLEYPVIARGMGRSYGDSALAGRVISSELLDNFIAFDADSGLLQCAAGVSLGEILRVISPSGWFLPVLPGTQYVSVGGAIASDVHGKNHHAVGAFSECVREFKLLLATGECLNCSREENAEAYHASCGGMGLTGIILSATLALVKVPGRYIRQESRQTRNLAETMELLDHSTSHYSVAWFDCLASGESLGRGVVFDAEHNQDAEPEQESESFDRSLISVPFSTPSLFVNRLSMKAFNAAYYRLHSGERLIQKYPRVKFFFPLDSISHWNRLYGGKGFLQYQLVLPYDSAREGIQKILSEVANSGKGSFLSVLKKFGEGNANPLSFPMAGFTLTLDFKLEHSLVALLAKLDELVIHHGGRLYLAKDARMGESTFRLCYPRWQEFLETKHKLDPQGKFASAQAKRLGLC